LQNRNTRLEKENEELKKSVSQLKTIETEYQDQIKILEIAIVKMMKSFDLVLVNIIFEKYKSA